MNRLAFSLVVCLNLSATVVAQEDKDFNWPVPSAEITIIEGRDGILMSHPETTAIRAIASGEVIFVGTLPKDKEVGLIVLLKHVDEFYSVYGRLGEVNVARGDTVSDGAQIATQAPGELLYFELRGPDGPVSKPHEYSGFLEE
ncbi:hypothetical protein COU14_02565 [Candidatus Kaiserbacteria bacterium CG10_big_fil_rev_8_21_14_0_10_44_10]|uniref:M23ase beta-sheet core domain-containing protein n=1 Tax=Candidatus Kaiserbacteria bacterium CG10_big_fil_rev_8_21_14_0_10_44_10 TaxID=1974606 RepID=A0A2H0UHB5_9BACT|nr:MAG: hypothetical protein COU14_02565 [Candidatus Kaiserbacteria bacterium CG10_big_fil_rev_8_21_14_0_10_44_10]